MSNLVSVLIPTHAPNIARLSRTLDGLRHQKLSSDRWELILVDNASPDRSFLASLDLSWHPRFRTVREDRLGLTFARLAGFEAASGTFLVLVDDDNVLAPDYLSEALEAFNRFPRLGAIGGRCLPEWEVAPPAWTAEFMGSLALRDLGDNELVSTPADHGTYPKCAPVGAGMVLRREVSLAYIQALRTTKDKTLPDRRGTQLSSGGDNDIVLTALAAGWEVGYFPQLQLTHLIPAGRLTRAYLARLNQGIYRSWVQVLARHGICPWTPLAPWTLPLRKLRAWWRSKAWRDDASYVRWCGLCGTFEGRASLTQ